jgi:hypothetical protein
MSGEKLNLDPKEARFEHTEGHSNQGSAGKGFCARIEASRLRIAVADELHQE